MSPGLEVVTSPAQVQRICLEHRLRGRSLGFVPTMGYLHAGHAGLMKLARPRVDVLVVSIFVNPAQFGPREDLASYPRDLERDLDLCRAEGVDIVFVPASADVYPPGYSTWVEETRLSAGLCGASRPGHFRGVATVVLKLFNLVVPTLAVFGSKDYQQARVVAKMVEDLDLPVEIVAAPIVRESDGLAMSSRNRYLSGSEREQARCLFRSLEKARGLFAAGERSAAALVAAMSAEIAAAPSARIDYVEVRDAETLEPVEVLERPAVAALAVFIGSTRLIDNVVLG